jgi:hypothetical protein
MCLERRALGPVPKEPVMSIVSLIAIWGVTATTAAVVAGILAGIKNRDYSFWISSTFIAPPLLIVLVLLPRLKERPKRPSIDEEEDAADRA